VEETESQDSLWTLRCKNHKCGQFFDYFGRRFRLGKAINCTHCGKASRYGVADFVRHNSVKEALPAIQK
jgi:hypothetical protein